MGLFVDEPGAKSSHPLVADQRSAVSDQRLVECLTSGGIVDVERVLQSGHAFRVTLTVQLRSPVSAGHI